MNHPGCPYLVILFCLRGFEGLITQKRSSRGSLSNGRDDLALGWGSAALWPLRAGPPGHVPFPPKGYRSLAGTGPTVGQPIHPCWFARLTHSPRPGRPPRPLSLAPFSPGPILPLPLGLVYPMLIVFTADVRLLETL